MTVAAALLLYVAAVLYTGPKVLVRITADGGAPRLAIAAWITAVVTVLGCSVAAVALLLIEAAGHWDSPRRAARHVPRTSARHSRRPRRVAGPNRRNRRGSHRRR